MSEFHREYESCDFHFDALSFKLVSVGKIGGERGGNQGKAITIPASYIYAFDTD